MMGKDLVEVSSENPRERVGGCEGNKFRPEVYTGVEVRASLNSSKEPIGKWV